jgi:hypothetical protein
VLPYRRINRYQSTWTTMGWDGLGLRGPALLRNAADVIRLCQPGARRENSARCAMAQYLDAMAPCRLAYIAC